VAGDLSQPEHCREVIAKAVEEFGRIDVLVTNAAYQMTRESLEDIPDEGLDHTIATNLSAMFHLCKAAVPRCSASGVPGSTASPRVQHPSGASGTTGGARVRRLTAKR